MSHLLVIPFADVQKAKEGANKLLSLQKRGQIEIEDAIVAMKNENGAVELKQLSKRKLVLGDQSRGKWPSRSDAKGIAFASSFTNFSLPPESVKAPASAQFGGDKVLVDASSGTGSGRLFRYSVPPFAQYCRRSLCNSGTLLSRRRQALRIPRAFL
jgi:hypothetical protein